jgi:hypothetical protein
MIWVNYVCGRLESRYRYSNNLVYNNFPWPEKVSKNKKQDHVEITSPNNNNIAD